MATIKLENIEKCYTKDIPVIKNLDLEINAVSYTHLRAHET